jgi:NAD(P)-dependent dehydrogenase (short-subunit alcohol dehydrogenase family)
MPYPLSKKLVEGYAKALRQELWFHGIDVIIVRPGAIRTELLSQVRNLNAATPAWILAKPFLRFASTASTEIGRMLEPAEAARRIFRIANIRRPRPLYKLNNMLKLRLAALLPFTLTEKIVRRRLS